jgi:hypothetical protein
MVWKSFTVVAARHQHLPPKLRRLSLLRSLSLHLIGQQELIPSPINPSGHLASAMAASPPASIDENYPPLDVHFGSLFNAFNCPISINAVHSKNNPDLFTYDEAMRSEHKDKWIKSTIKEISELEEHRGWIKKPIPEGV